MRKIWLIVLSLLLLGAIAYYKFGFSKSASSDTPIYITATKGQFKQEITATGELRAKNSVKVRGPMRMRDAGVYNASISRIIPEGTVVKKGDWIASLDKSGITTKMEEIQTEIDRNETQLEQVRIDTAIELSNLRAQLSDIKFDLKQKELEVEQSQYEAQMIIQQAELSLERLERDYKKLTQNFELKKQQSRAKVAEYNASLRQARNKMAVLMEISQEFDIKAPDDGMLIYLSSWNGDKIREGSQVSAWNPEVGELPDLSEMKSISYVNEVDISYVHRGQKVIVRADAFPDKEYQGEVTSVANVGQQLRNSDAKVFEVVVSLNKSDSLLRPAMTSSNTILIRELTDVIRLPLEALHKKDSVDFVILRSSAGPVRQEIVTSLYNENFMLVDAGLEPGDQVFLHYPSTELEDLRFLPLSAGVKLQTLQNIKAREMKYQEQVNMAKANAKQDFSSNSSGSSSAPIMIFR